jgi:transcriptional regulator with GAF, ATPase, and Fis domain
MSSMYDGPRPLVSFSGLIRRRAPRHCVSPRSRHSRSPRPQPPTTFASSSRPTLIWGDAVRRGAFRADLLDRLRLSMLSLPPLRDRPDDIVPLARYFVGQFARSHGGALSLSIDAEERLRRYRWPGNVRELSIVIERAARRRKREEIGNRRSFLKLLPATTPKLVQIGRAAVTGRPVTTSPTPRQRSSQR